MSSSLHALLGWVSVALVAVVSLEHVGFLVLEMFVWTSRRGQKIFGTTPEFAAESAALAANQGLYNGFLAAGLAWSLVLGPAPLALPVRIFFLSCVAVAGVFGGLTAKRSILVLQALPAIVALGVTLAAR